jgi:antitoxin (DNA-binding transcriptional repressor) of toxin-antitoxin stability system
VNIAEAKTQLSALVDATLRGDEVVIARRDVPLVRLVAVQSAKVKPRCGVLKGVAEIADDFDAPLDDFAGYMG